MGLFKRLFKKRTRPAGKISAKRLKQIEALLPQSTPLSEDKYWSMISRSLRKTSSMEEQRQKLIRLVGKLKCEEMVAFHLRTVQLLEHSYNEDLWCAAYLIEEGCDVKGFEYFRCWLISCGQKVYENALRDPDTLLAVLERGVEDHSFEAFYYVVEEAFELETGKSVYDYIKSEPGLGKKPEIHLSWSANDPDSMRHVCPGLFMKFAR